MMPLLIAIPGAGRAGALIQDASYGASDWQTFGAAEMEKAPPRIKDANTPLLDKVKYITTKVEDELVRRRYTANTSTVGRVVALVKTGDLETGTCGDLTSILWNALEGVKVDVLDANGRPKTDPNGKHLQAPLLAANQLQTVVGAKAMYLEKDDLAAVGDDGKPKYMTENQDAFPRSRQDLVNDSHGALVVMVTGKPYVFDLWMFGYEGDESLKGFSGSKWNGLPLTEWGKAMMFKGYKQFQIGNELAPNPWSSLEKTVKSLTALTAPTVTAPLKAEADKTLDEALGNALKRVDAERKATPPAAAVDKTLAACLKPEQDRYQSALAWYPKIRNKDSPASYSCQPMAGGQQYPPKACCDAYYATRNNPGNWDESWYVLQECAWKPEIAKRLEALDKKREKCVASTAKPQP